MSLKLKALCITLVVFLSYFLAAGLIQRALIVPAFLKADEEQAIRDIQRARRGFAEEVNRIDGICSDWAAWDDTYSFVADGSSAYRESNLIETTFTNNSVHLIYIVDSERRVVWSRVMAPGGSEIELAEFPPEVLGSTHPLARRGFVGSRVSGYMLTEAGPMVVASHPILRSDKTGPSRGAFVMGRLVTEEFVAELNERLMTDLEVAAFHGTRVEEEALSKYEQVSSDGESFLINVGDEQISCVAEEPALGGSGSVLLRSRSDRKIQQSFVEVRRVALPLFVLLSAGLFSALVIFVNNAVVRRLAGFVTEARDIADSADAGRRVSERGSDEVTLMSKSVNKMLASLEDKDRELQEQSSQLQIFVESSPLPLAMFDREFRLIWSSRRFDEAYRVGGENDDSLSEGAGLRVLPETRNGLRKACRRAMEGEPVVDGRDCFVTPRGHTVWLRWEAQPWRRAGGEVGGIIVLIEDITFRKLAEDEIRLSSQAMSSALNAVAISDTDWKIVYVNPQLVTLWGYESEDDFIGRPTSEFWLMDENARSVERAIEEDGGWIGEMAARKKDGTLFDIHVSASLVLDDDGEVTSIMASFVDISERARMERELRSTTDQLSLVLESHPVITYIADADEDMEVTFVSGNFQDITGYDGAHFLGDVGFWMERLHPEDAWETVENLYAIFDTDFVEQEYRWRVADGSYHWFFDSLRLVRNEDETPSHVVGMMQDITWRKTIERRVLDSQQRLDSILGSLKDIVWSADPGTFRVIYHNPAADDIFGRPFEDFFSEPHLWAELVHPEDKDKAWRLMVEFASKGYSEGEYRIVRPDGNVRWLHSRTYLIHDRRGNPVRIDNVTRDVTERRTAEEALAESRERLDGILRSLTDVVWSISLETRKLLYINPAAEDVYGISVDELRTFVLSDWWRKVVHPEDREPLKFMVQDLDKKGRLEYEYRVQRPDGETRWLRDRVTLIRDAEGAPNRIDGISTDITEARAATRALRESEERFESILGGLRDVVWSLRADDLEIIYINPAAEELYGRSLDDLLGDPTFWTDAIHPGDREMYDRRIEELLANDSVEFVYRLVRRGGEVRWVRNRSRIVRDEDGVARRIDGSHMDITDSRMAADALAESEQKYRLLAENVADVIWILDLDFKFTYISPSFERLLGYRPDEFELLTLKDVLTDESYEGTMKVVDIARYVAEHPEDYPDAFKPISFEQMQRRKDGTFIWVELNATFFTDSGGKLAGIIGVSRDVTSRKRIEDALRESESRYRILAENVAEVIWTMDLDLSFTYVSPSSALLLGYTPEEMLELGIEEIIRPEELRPVRQIAAMVKIASEDPERYKMDKSPITYEQRQRRKDGTEIWVEVTSRTLFDEEGRPTGFIGTSRDVSDRKQAETELRASEEKYQTLFVAAPDGILILDQDSRVIDANQMVARILSITRRRLQGLPFPELLDTDQGTSTKLRARIVRALRGVTGMGVRAKVRAQGEVKWVECQVFPLRRDGEVYSLQVTVRDVSERMAAEHAIKEAERELANQRALAMSTDRLRSLGEMATAMAHELNQPLQGVRGLAEHLLIGQSRGWDLNDDKVTDKLNTIVEQSDRMAYIIDHLRKYARSADDVHFDPVDVNQVITTTVRLMGTQLRSRGVKLDMDLGDDIPLVSGNQYALEEVFINLIVNARDSMEEKRRRGDDPGPIRIVTSRVGADSGALVKIEIVDRGVGISYEIRQRVFEPFFTTKNPDEGTGLGLAVAKTIVENHNGHIELNNTPGGGVTAVIALPAVGATATLEEAEA